MIERLIPFVLVALLVSVATTGIGEDNPILARVPPKTPAQAFQSFQVAEGFELELVAAEPLLASPIAIAFDDAGRMLVVEMIDYSEQAEEKLGRISRLTDVDQDGRMDRAEILAEGLSWPTALAIIQEGVLVVHPPKMSLVSEGAKIQELFDGFARNNVQGMANSFHWGLDQRLHLSTSSNGAQLTGRGLGSPFELRGRDLGLDPRSLQVFSEPGGGQHGMDFNPWGDKFVSSNSDHLQQVVAWDEPWLEQSRVSSTPQWRRSIADDGPQADVYRLSPIEGWREWRTQMRIAGGATGPIEGGGRAAGYFTGATGVVIYDGDQWHEANDDPFPTAIVADVGGNLVHRKKLTTNQLQWIGSRIDVASELVRSSDVWFRPVQFSDGPDGCLYIVDMYREVIEHPASLPPPIKSQLDLTSGRDRGRIWRLKNKHLPIRRKLEPLSRQSTEQLVALLGHRNGWHRETASRLLFERQDLQAIPMLKRLLASAKLPEARLQAIATLGGLPQGLDTATLLQGMSDSHPRVRQFAVKQLDRFDAQDPNSEPLRKKIEEMASEPSLHVRFSLAGRAKRWMHDDTKRAELLAAWIQNDWDCNELRFAIESSSGPAAKEMIDRMLAQGNLTISASPWLQSLLFQVALHQGLEAATQLVDASRHSTSPSDKGVSKKTWLLMSALGRYVKQVQSSLTENDRKLLAAWTRVNILPLLNQWMNDPSQVLEEDPASICMLASGLELTERIELLSTALRDHQAISLQRCAIAHWIGSESETASLALARLSSLPPESHSELLRTLAKRKEQSQLLLAALESKQVDRKQIPTDVWSMLEQQNPNDTERIQKLRGGSPAMSWESLADRYRPAWKAKADAKLGRALFEKHCSSCHKVGGLGTEIGPGLASILSKSNEQIAIAVAEPSREVDPKYQVYQLVTDDGELLVGILEESTAQAYSIRDNRGARRSIDRSTVQSFSTLGKSLMPDNLLEQIDPKSLNDLIGFLRARE